MSDELQAGRAKLLNPGCKQSRDSRQDTGYSGQLRLIHLAAEHFATRGRQDAVRDDWNCPSGQPRRGEGNRPHSRPTDPPQRRRNPRHQELGRLLSAPPGIEAPSAPSPRPLLCHALRLRHQDARRGPQDAQRRPAHDSRRQRKAGRWEIDHVEQVWRDSLEGV